MTIDALTGAFLKTRVVTLHPRFIIRNDLGREVGVLPTLEIPPKGGYGYYQNSSQSPSNVRKRVLGVRMGYTGIAPQVHDIQIDHLPIVQIDDLVHHLPL